MVEVIVETTEVTVESVEVAVESVEVVQVVAEVVQSVVEVVADVAAAVEVAAAPVVEVGAVRPRVVERHSQSREERYRRTSGHRENRLLISDFSNLINQLLKQILRVFPILISYEIF